jgi:hypothetical protein
MPKPGQRRNAQDGTFADAQDLASVKSSEFRRWSGLTIGESQNKDKEDGLLQLCLVNISVSALVCPIAVNDDKWLNDTGWQKDSRCCSTSDLR